MRTRVKVCGLTNPADAVAAVRAGVDAVGVVLAPSPRHVSLEEAEGILSVVPPMVARLGVFVDADQGFVEEAVVKLGLTAVQFHGSESPEDCRRCSAPVIKALRVKVDGDAAGGPFAAAGSYRGSVSGLLLDTYVEGVAGGTGKPFPWDRVRAEAPRWSALTVAGGLNPVNVGAAVRSLRPFAVDVCSGVEEHVGMKDRLKIEAFVDAVRAADSSMREERE